MKRVTVITLMFIFITTIIDVEAQLGDPSNLKQLNAGHGIKELRVKRVTKPVALGTGTRKHKNRTVELIPADESLRSEQFSEEVEEQLGSTGIGKNSANTRNRRGHKKRACIYIDIPGSQAEEEVDIIIPGALSRPTFEKGTSSNDEEFGEAEKQQNLAAAESGSPEMQYLQANDELKTSNDGIDDMGNVYWLRLPPSETVRSRDVLKNLYEVVNDFHESGKDVLFVPISKGYLSPDEAQNGFLKTLQMNPIEREKTRKAFKIKLM